MRNHHAYLQQVRDAAARVAPVEVDEESHLNWDEALAFDSRQTGDEPSDQTDEST